MRLKRILAGVFALALLLAACGGQDEPTPDPAPSDEADAAEDTDEAPSDVDASGLHVAVAYDLAGRGDGGFNDLAYDGAQAAADELGIELTEVTATADDSDQDRIDRLQLLAESGHNPIIAVGFTYAEPVAEVAAQFPDVWFGIVDDASVDAPNVVGLTFAEHEGSFLVGVAAALKTETGNVGFIGGVNIPLIQKFEAGFIAGVEAVDPDITIQTAYLSQPPDFAGFNDPGLGREAATGMFDNGADIVYAAAGGSGAGVFQAADEAGTFAIGVDSDQYVTADQSVNHVIITSMLKLVDAATYEFTVSVADGSVAAGEELFGLARGGVGYATSGGAIDDIVGELDEWRERIINGDVSVPDSVS